MRQHHIRNREGIMRECGKYIAADPAALRGRWKEAFASDAPLFLELGSGKGRFITTLAQLHPENNYLACEGQYNVYPRIIQKAASLELGNMLLIAQYITDPSELFADGEIDGIYLNFSDPWKKRTANRRLTCRSKLEGYRRICSKGAFLEFKTDNDELFEYSLQELEASGLIADRVDYDLHSSDLAESNIRTEYEERFTEKGLKIKYFHVFFT